MSSGHVRPEWRFPITNQNRTFLSGLLIPVTITEAFVLAQQHQQAGSLLQAVEIYRQILQADPVNAPVLYYLGTAYEALRNLPEAVECYRRLVQVDPNRPEVHNQLGMALYRQGKPAEAVHAYQRALQLRPDHAETYSNLGVALSVQGELERAIDCYRQALRLRPDYAAVHNNLGAALRERGQLQEAVACHRRAVQLNPDYPEAYINLGNTLRDQGDAGGAAAAYRQALRLRPDFAEAHNNLGAAMRDQGQPQEAVACYRRALELNPGYFQAQNNLGNALRDQGDVSGAASAYRLALTLEPDYAEAHNNLAGALQEQGCPGEAVQHALDALRLHPDWAEPLFMLADLAANGYYEFPEAQLHRMEALAGAPSVSLRDASTLHFGLALLIEQRGAHDDAFDHYRQANALKYRLFHETGRAFDPDQHDRAIDQLIATFSPAFFERVRGFGQDTELPVFIVGMPRSGTTLVEHVLSRHPLVFAAGELTKGGTLAEELPARLGAPEGYPRCLDRLDQAASRTIAEDYRRRLARRGGEAARVTDKGPLNYLHLGLLAALFPRARVIHCRRDPRDVCLSCYFQFFQDEVNFAWDLNDLARYYRSYERLMDHWRAVLPVQPLEVVYEELVANPEPRIRQLVAFCGLEWDDRCLASHESRRPVQTLSKLQVRRPIYTSAVGRWRRFEGHLGPLLEALGRVAGLEGANTAER
jgi:tetratricopeptide (TPR) repeat protein